MEDRDLAEKLLSGVVEENLATYRHLITETSSQDASDLYWKGALALFKKLNSDERDVFFKIPKQVSIDTVSNVAGILDGSSEAGLKGELQIISKSGKRLSGCLQDHFLEAIEEESK